MDRYPTTLDKLALVVTASVAAKEISVKEFGVGEDLPFNIYGWRNDELTIMAQLDSSLMNEDSMDRFNRLTNAACIMRKGFLVDSFTLLAEGFCSSDPQATKDKKLAEAYLEPNSPVKECLTFTHVANGKVAFITKSYAYAIPRKVEWDDEQYFPGATLFRTKDGAIPLMFDRVLTLDVAQQEDDDVNLDDYYQYLGDGLLEHGFFAQWFV